LNPQPSILNFKSGIAIGALVQMNKTEFPSLVANSRLRSGTVVRF
jgi:hypothetical protein